jgi:hypothetical protein
MRSTALGVLIALLLAATAFGAFGDVVSSFEHPGKTPGTVGTAGLAWDGSCLWFAGEPWTLFVRTTTTGSIVGSFDLGSGYSYIVGLGYDGSYLWYSWKMMGEDYYYSRVNTNGSFISRFSGGPFGPGVTCENNYVWCGPAKFTTGGSFLSSFTPPFELSELGW